jgi:5-oxoprolinase (ATP-hydrolysing) subunit A
MNRSVDINGDLGEGAGNDAQLMPWVSSANIACGAHAGDETTMRATVLLAKKQGVAIGAHPGFADREHFGRRELALSATEIVALVSTQTQALRMIAQGEGAVVTHVKPHGALYNLAARDAVVADAIAEAVAAVDTGLWLYALSGGALLKAGRARGLRMVAEVFADRTYQDDGSLTARNRPDALVTEVGEAVAQVLRMVRDGVVRSVNGCEIPITADTICVHGDGAHAVEFARELHAALKAAGVGVRPMAR